MNTPAHPIAPAMREEIENELGRIEKEHGVKILYACESGSRGWGFASPDSDYDVRFLYVHPLDWYLRVLPERDVIELPISGDLDINGWELRKALGLLRKGNATLVEWFDSPVVYRADADFLAQIKEAARRCHRPERSFHHYLHMAKRNNREFLRKEKIRLKKYLYVLRPILACLWIQAGRGPAPMPFDQLVESMVGNPEVRAAIRQLVEKKRQAGESEQGPPIRIISDFIDEQLQRLENSAPCKDDSLDFSMLDRLLMDTALSTQTSTAG